MHSIIRFAFPATLAAIMLVPFSAQAAEVRPRTINQRQVNQQRRIFNGVKDDQLSRQEYFNLQKRSYSVERQQRQDLRDGTLSGKERYQLNQRLNRISDAIASDRHN